MSEHTTDTAGETFAELTSGIRICLRDKGPRTAPAILLIAGLGEDLTAWSADFVAALLGQGFRVVVIDNRDVGRSTFMRTPPPALWRQALARPRGDGYSLADMASDAVGVLDHLGIERAHLVGRSMGGMIAQTIAASRPERTLSLTSIYSTTGDRKVGQPALSTMALLLGPTPRSRTAAVRAHLRITAHIAGTDFPIDEVEEAAVAARGWDRTAGNAADGVARQIQAIQASGDRTPQLAGITAPTLVINGDRDLMVAATGGTATVAAIPGAQHVVIPGMGHHLHPELVDPISRYVTEHAERSHQGGARIAIS